jgi:hypothetical protein
MKHKEKYLTARNSIRVTEEEEEEGSISKPFEMVLSPPLWSDTPPLRSGRFPLPHCRPDKKGGFDWIYE